MACLPITAVVVDDHFEGVTEIVRGADLVEPTVRQISLYQQFGWTVPDYIHLPLAVNEQGVSCQNRIMPRRCLTAIRARY